MLAKDSLNGYRLSFYRLFLSFIVSELYGNIMGDVMKPTKKRETFPLVTGHDLNFDMSKKKYFLYGKILDDVMKQEEKRKFCLWWPLMTSIFTWASWIMGIFFIWGIFTRGQNVSHKKYTIILAAKWAAIHTPCRSQHNSLLSAVKSTILTKGWWHQFSTYNRNHIFFRFCYS